MQLLPWMVLAVGVAASFGVSYWQARDYEQRRETRFIEETDEITIRLRSSLAGYEELNTAIAEQARPLDGHRTTAAEFATFVDGMVLDSHFPGTFGVAWADSVPSDQLGALTADESLPVASLQDLRPVGSADNSVVVTLAEPDATMSIARGVDARSFPPIATTVDSALATSQVRASEPFALPLRFGPDKDNPPVVVFLARPVLRSDADLSSPEGRIAGTDGIATVALDMGRYIPEAGGALQDRYAMTITDEAASGDTFLARTQKTPLAGGARRTVEMDAFGRTWSIDFQEATLVVYGEQNPATSTLLGGLVVTGLVFVIVLLISRSERRARVLVDRATAELSLRATHDSLTHLANRSELLTQLERALEAHAEESSPTLLFIDLDRFKLVNDSLGHTTGDQMLVMVAERLQSAVRPDDMVARLGGDEFVVLAQGIKDDRAAIDLVMRLQAALNEPVTIDGHELFVSASIGIATDTTGRESAESLIGNADAAMYAAKEGGVGNYAVFEPSMHRLAVERLTLLTDLRYALSRGELRLEHQPQYALETGELSGIESLMRWDHPTRGTIPPEEFIPLAEQSGLIRELGAWAIHEGCSQGVRWQDLAGRPIPVSVNVSVHQLIGSELECVVEDALLRTGLDPRALCLEITEGTLIRNLDSVAGSLGRLRERGLMIAADDFGTGYSSLGQIKRLPVDILKIDRSFIECLADDPKDKAIVAAVVDLAHALGMSSVAEGIETDEQRRIALELGVDHAQGWWFQRSVSSELIDELIVAHTNDREGSLSVRLGTG